MFIKIDNCFNYEYKNNASKRYSIWINSNHIIDIYQFDNKLEICLNKLNDTINPHCTIIPMSAENFIKLIEKSKNDEVFKNDFNKEILNNIIKIKD